MLLLKIGVRQVYEIILLLANLNYLVIWRDNLKLSQYPKQECILVEEGGLLKIPVINVHTLRCYPIVRIDTICEN